MNILEMNDLLFEQMKRLHAAGKDDIAAEASRSKEMAHLAGEIVDNNRLAMQAAAMQARAQSELACAVTMEQTIPAMLLGNAPEPCGGKPAPPDEAGLDEVDAFLAEHAAAHTVSWLADRLRSEVGAKLNLDEVEQRCAAIGVDPRRLMA